MQTTFHSEIGSGSKWTAQKNNWTSWKWEFGKGGGRLQTSSSSASFIQNSIIAGITMTIISQILKHQSDITWHNHCIYDLGGTSLLCHIHTSRHLHCKARLGLCCSSTGALLHQATWPMKAPTELCGWQSACQPITMEIKPNIFETYLKFVVTSCSCYPQFVTNPND